MRRLRTARLLLLAAGACVGPLGTAGVASQNAAPPVPEREPTVDSALWTGTHYVQVRWLHAGEQPERKSFTRSPTEVLIDSVVAGMERSYLLRIGRDQRRGTLRIPGDGGRIEAWVEPPDFARILRPPGPDPRTIQFASMTLAPGGSALLDDARLWDIGPLERPPLAPGATRRDTLSFRAERFGFLQALDGPRVTTVLRDTTIDGRRLWIGRDNARVRYRERVLHWRRSLDTLVVVEREARGTLRGRFLYDPELGLFRARWDTLAATGQATFERPDGTVYRSAASYERRLAWTLRSPAEQRVWEEEAERRRKLNAMSMVRLPGTPLQRRIAGGDTVVADSLVRAWPAADRQERMRIRADLAFAPPRYRERLDSLEVAEGGWVSRVGGMTHRVWGGPPLDSAEMALYLRLLREPSLAFDHAIDLDPAYENLAGGLVMHPPGLGAPAERTSCTPPACRLLAGEGDAEEPRLRKVALVARFILEPERWVDSLLARPDTASHLLHDAVLLARGVGATWPIAEKRAIPPPGADWREWHRWTGTDTSVGQRERPPSRIRFGDTHRYAIRMTERLTGRDIGAEVSAAADTATADSARAFFRSLALRLGATTPTLAEVVPALGSADETERDLAFIALRQLERDRQPADPALAEEVVGELLAQVIDGDSLWSVGPRGDRPRPVEAGRDGEGSMPLFLARENLPEPVRSYWDERDGVAVITRQEWRGQPPREPGVLLVVGEVTTLGPLVWVTLDRWVRQARAHDEAPRGWASGEHLTLLRTGDEWVIISVGTWVT